MLQDKNREEEELLVVVHHVVADHVEVVEVEDLVAGVEGAAEAVVPGGAGVEDKK